MISAKSSAQIITTKKEAQKKGVYSYTEKQKAPAKTTIDKQAVVKEVASLNNSEIVGYEPVVKKEMVMNPGKSETPVIKKNPVSISTEKVIVVVDNNKTEVINEKDEAEYAPSDDSGNYLGEQLVNNAVNEFKGVRYRGGGTTKAGMDCSGMVYATFKIFDITLPRSSHEMTKATKEVKLTEVKKGDLLFFRNNHNRKTINHVGMVTEVTEEGEVKFIHSSTSSGVIISSMNEPYNARTFVQAGRYTAE
jgi:cell wall-associated NlpC family hydrolase